MDLLSIALLGGGIVLIWAAMKDKSPLDAIKLLTSGQNPTEAKPVAGDTGATTTEAPGGSQAPRTIGGSDPPNVTV
jgi:hypothetical protein